MRRVRRALLVALLCLLPCARLVAHVPLIHPTSGTPLRWSPGPVVLTLHDGAPAGLEAEEAATAVRLAMDTWNDVAGARVQLVEDVAPENRASDEWFAPELHVVRFDGANASGWFPYGSATVALTPVWFASDGRIVDADVFFNAAGFSFGTRGESTRMDVQDIAAHELGHVLGLDHTGASGGTLYPYVDQGLILKRSLSEDERAGVRDAYPARPFGELTGRVVRAQGGAGVSGAYVVARDADGRARASILADSSGVFRLRGLEPGAYLVYARPLDVPVGEANLGSGYRGSIEVDFEAAAFREAVVLPGAGAVALGDLAVGAAVALALGSRFDPFPLHAEAGATRTLYVHGSGLVEGSTLSASDPDLVLGPPTWRGSQVSFTLTVPAGEPRGHVDLEVVDPAGARAILPFALEVTPPAPLVASVTPSSGSIDGGERLTLSGANFSAGSRVVIGARIYTDGVDASVLDEHTLALTTAATAPGLHDVVVIDASGVEGRLLDGFRARSAPALADLRPRAGCSAGGTSVWLAGTDFVPGLRVAIAGVDQGPVEVESTTRARFTTRPGVPSGPCELVLVNPDGAVAVASFTYVAAPDPALASVEPGLGSEAGGELLTLRGSGFAPDTGVWFCADAAGTATAALDVRFVDATTLAVRTPAHAPGAVALLVAGADGSGVVAEDAFAFEPESSGGGACQAAPARAPRAVPEAVALALLLALLARRAESARASRRRAA